MKVCAGGKRGEAAAKSVKSVGDGQDGGKWKDGIGRSRKRKWAWCELLVAGRDFRHRGVSRMETGGKAGGMMGAACGKRMEDRGMKKRLEPGKAEGAKRERKCTDHLFGSHADCFD